jgi:hypothetical protein
MPYGSGCQPLSSPGMALYSPPPLSTFPRSPECRREQAHLTAATPGVLSLGYLMVSKISRSSLGEKVPS